MKTSFVSSDSHNCLLIVLFLKFQTINYIEFIPFIRTKELINNELQLEKVLNYF